MPFRLQTFCITVFIRINALGAYLLFGLLGWRLFEAGAYFNKLTENVWLKIAKYLQFLGGGGGGASFEAGRLSTILAIMLGAYSWLTVVITVKKNLQPRLFYTVPLYILFG